MHRSACHLGIPRTRAAVGGAARRRLLQLGSTPRRTSSGPFLDWRAISACARDPLRLRPRLLRHLRHHGISPSRCSMGRGTRAGGRDEPPALTSRHGVSRWTTEPVGPSPSDLARPGHGRVHRVLAPSCKPGCDGRTCTPCKLDTRRVGCLAAVATSAPLRHSRCTACCRSQ
jgi:hypothetical protein